MKFPDLQHPREIYVTGQIHVCSLFADPDDILCIIG